MTSSLPLWALNVSVAYQKALNFLHKYLNLCSENERRSWGFGTTWGRVINDRIFGWTTPLTRTLIKGTEKGVAFTRLSMQKRLLGRLKFHSWLHQLDTTVNYPDIYAVCSDSHNGNRWEGMAWSFSDNLAAFPLTSNVQSLHSFE